MRIYEIESKQNKPKREDFECDVYKQFHSWQGKLWGNLFREQKGNSQSILLLSEDCFSSKRYFSQECIPVGCVPAARRPYAGVCFPGGGGGGWGGLLPEGVCSRGSGPGGAWCRGGLVPGGLPPRGVSQHACRGVWSQGGVCSRGGVCYQGGLVLGGLVLGGSAPGGYPSMH